MLMCVQTHIQTHTNAHAHCAGMHMHVHAHTHRERESKRHKGKDIPNNSIVRTGQEKWSDRQSRGMQAILYNGSCSQYDSKLERELLSWLLHAG